MRMRIRKNENENGNGNGNGKEREICYFFFFLSFCFPANRLCTLLHIQPLLSHHDNPLAVGGEKMIRHVHCMCCTVYNINLVLTAHVMYTSMSTPASVKIL